MIKLYYLMIYTAVSIGMHLMIGIPIEWTAFVIGAIIVVILAEW